MKQSQVTWRSYLGDLLELPGEKTRAAHELGVSSLTLTRWVEGKTEPRPGSLRKLPSVFSGHEPRLTALIREAYDPAWSGRMAHADVLPLSVPSEFHARVLAVAATTAGPIVTASICNLVLRQAIDQLDHEPLGMEIIVVPCTPPSSGMPVRSLCERFGVGTAPWPQGVGRRLQFLGAESLSGYVTGTGEPGIIQDMEQEQGPLPVRVAPHERSAAAYPLMRRGRIAGSFLVSSSQQNFFSSERIALVEQYANLAALAFSDEEFYRPKEISLEVMPPFAAQQHDLAQFRQRVVDRRKSQNYHLSEIEAERFVLQEIEERLLQSMSGHDTKA